MPMNASVKLPMRLKDLTPINRKYLDDDEHRFIITSAGRRSRKTLIGKSKLLYRALKTPNQRLFHAAPTRAQAKSIFWEQLLADTNGLRARDPDYSFLYVTLFNGTQIHIVGLDKPQRVEGQTWHGCHITEFADLKKGAWASNIRPVLSDTKGWAILDGVPEMTNPDYYEMAKRAAGGQILPTEPNVGSYGQNGEWAFYTWFSADVLDPEEVEAAREELDPKTFKQEYEGSFETAEGQVYYGYTADYYPHGNLDESVEYDPNIPIYIGFDFNVNPMTAILFQRKRAKDGPNKGKEEMLVFKGYYLKNSNTEQLAERICMEYPDTKIWYIVTCQSGQNRQTVGDLGVTDRKIIRNIFARHGNNVNFNHRTRNPPVAKKIHALNGMLHHNRIRINPKDPGLKELTRDLSTLVHKVGSSDIDTSDPDRGHASDALGYPTERYYPVQSEIAPPTYISGV